MDLPRPTATAAGLTKGAHFSVDEHGRSLFNAVLATSVPSTAPITQSDPAPSQTEDELEEECENYSEQRERTFFFPAELDTSILTAAWSSWRSRRSSNSHTK